MAVLPSEIEKQDNLDCRLGIKSSLSNISSVIALAYLLYCANNRESAIIYADEVVQSNGKKALVLKDTYKRWIMQNYDITEDKLENNPLFTSQLEALQVGLGLMFHLAKVSFVDFPTTDTKERTGGERFKKKMEFALNMKLLDLYLTAWPEEVIKSEMVLWLDNSPSNETICTGMKQILTAFSEGTQFKIRAQGKDVLFQQIGIYNKISSNEDRVIAKDEQEDVGPFRIFKSFVREGLHPYLLLQKNEFLCNRTEDLEQYKEMVGTTLNLYPKEIVLYQEVSANPEIDSSNIKDSRQMIYYGAPGTGKSHKIKEQLELENVPEENIFRTTFHPDSDYSTFVGAYKPTMENDEPLYNKGQLISKLTELNTQGVSYAAQKFGAKYWYSLRRLTPFDEKEILQACGMKESFTDEIDKGVAVGEALLQRKDSRIVYGFVPQVFLNAYTQAYKKPKENIYLIIEEINRGNCAQIFGDLFQLLDRDENGISEYPIKADTDVKTFLESELGVDKPGIKDGELCLPSNLYIYATMNTSDQSLFPIDSAFKRRWDWEYEPIKYENTDWVIDIQGEKYLWTSFQKEVNRRIFEAANSEDKQLGDYFVNPRDGVITENILVNKILFYLWNDVCKDGEGDIFKVSDTEDVSFSELYIDKGKLIKLMDYLHVEKSMNGDKDQSSENEEENDEEAPTTPQSV